MSGVNKKVTYISECKQEKKELGTDMAGKRDIG